MSKWKVGDKPWLSHAGIQEVKKECPICTGKLTVELILGNGDHVILPCDYCGKGWDGPRGFVIEREFIVGVEQLTISQIDTEATEDGEKIHYHFFGHRYAGEDDLCETKEGAEVKSSEWIAQNAIEESTRAEYLKHNQNKTYSWTAGYHLREAKREEESAARHRERAKLCKAKSKMEEVR
jgi:hypothetical protein